MMILSDVGAVQILTKYFNNVSPVGGNNLTLKLYTNNLDPVDTNTASDFTVATGGGYADITLAAATWSVSLVGGIAQAAYPVQSFAFTGALTGSVQVYGWYIVDADGTLVYAQKAVLPFTPVNSGDILKITPVIQLSKGTPT